MSSRLIFLVPDCHVPYHHVRAVRNVWQCIADHRPDEVVQLGDFLDMKAPARWSKGIMDEFLAGVDKEAKAGRAVLSELRDLYGYDGNISWVEGNHERRLRDYIKKSAPALAGVVPSVPELLDFDGLGVVHQGAPYLVAPGTVAIHGEKLSSTQGAAGQSAFKERVRHGKSVVQGHSHRLGLGFDTSDTQRFWLEAGWLGNIRHATYLSFPGLANWSMGFGTLVVDGKKVTPSIHVVNGDGSFMYGGKKYGG